MVEILIVISKQGKIKHWTEKLLFQLFNVTNCKTKYAILINDNYCMITE